VPAVRSFKCKVIEKASYVSVASMLGIRRGNVPQNVEFEHRILAAIRIGRENFCAGPYAK
jgi:hypothetical protein